MAEKGLRIVTIQELEWVVGGLLGILLIVIGRIFMWFHCRMTDCEIRMREAVTKEDMHECSTGIRNDVREQSEHTLTRMRLIMSEHTNEITRSQREELDAIRELAKATKA